MDKTWPTHEVLLSWFLYDKLSSHDLPTPADLELWLEEFNSKPITHWHEAAYNEYKDFRENFMSTDAD